ncbi:MAG: 30S ribosomal protein S20 [Planctomycetaceae bacterium]|nr:30S ribosomal protein S20 [Planctomycetaceae bacterium]
MPNTPNADKALRKSLKRRDRNRMHRSALRTYVKRVREAVEAGDEEKAKAAFQRVTKKLDQAASKNLIHKNAAARTKSRLSKQMKKAFAS